MPVWVLHQRLVLRAIPGCPGRRTETAERELSLGLGQQRQLLLAKRPVIIGLSGLRRDEDDSRIKERKTAFAGGRWFIIAALMSTARDSPTRTTNGKAFSL